MIVYPSPFTKGMFQNPRSQGPLSGRAVPRTEPGLPLASLEQPSVQTEPAQDSGALFTGNGDPKPSSTRLSPQPSLWARPGASPPAGSHSLLLITTDPSHSLHRITVLSVYDYTFGIQKIRVSRKANTASDFHRLGSKFVALLLYPCHSV